MSNNVNISKEDVKKTSKEILDMCLGSIKQIIFKYILGIFIKNVLEKNNIKIEDLKQCDEETYLKVMNLLQSKLEPILKDELDYIVNK